MSRSSEPFGTITPVDCSYKIGLDIADPPVVNLVQECAVARWTVQGVDNERDYYRLYVSDGEKDYGLRLSEDGTITAVEARPTSLGSHVWFIPHLADGYHSIMDPASIRGWKVNGRRIELEEPPVGEDGLKPFKFKFSF